MNSSKLKQLPLFIGRPKSFIFISENHNKRLNFPGKNDNRRASIAGSLECYVLKVRYEKDVLYPLNVTGLVGVDKTVYERTICRFGFH